MDDILSIRIKIADRDLGLKVRPDMEVIVREAGKIVRERVEEYRRTHRDMTDIFAMIALQETVERLRAEEQSRRLQRTVFDKLTQLDQLVTPTLTS